MPGNLSAKPALWQELRQLPYPALRFIQRRRASTDSAAESEMAVGGGADRNTRGRVRSPKACLDLTAPKKPEKKIEHFFGNLSKLRWAV
jgi:hypothetical protein